jgi:LysR family transcriptional regulator, nitrogen assimilation regulatory protein
MDLKALRAVVEAARLGSIRKAAAHLCVAQPALSRQIRLLEEDLGVSLLVRYRHGVSPTKDGIDLLRYAESLLRTAQQLRDDMSSRTTEPVGLVRVGFPPAPGALLLAKLVAEFIRQYPKVKFQLRESLTADLTDFLLADKLDLAIMIYDAKHQSLRRKPLFAEDIWLVGIPAIWPFKSRALNFQQLDSLPLIHPTFLGNALAKLAVRHKVKLTTVIEGDPRAAAREAFRAGLGFLLLPASSVTSDIASGAVVGAPIKGFEVRRGLFWRADRPLSRAAIEFSAQLERAVEKLKLDSRAVIRNIEGTNYSFA